MLTTFQQKDIITPPTDTRDALTQLVQAGIISRKDLPIYATMIGFRNRVVHGYQEVSPERVLEIANKELGDFERFIRQVLSITEESH